MEGAPSGSRTSTMAIGCPVIPVAPAIRDLINHYAERGRMLHRSLEAIYEMLREFVVAVDDGQVRRDFDLDPALGEGA